MCSTSTRISSIHKDGSLLTLCDAGTGRRGAERKAGHDTFSSVKASEARQTVENDPCPRSFTSLYLSPTCTSSDLLQVRKL